MGLLNNLNYIKHVWTFPCANPNPIIILETALEAAGPVLLELQSWSCRDIMKLRAGISYRCGRTVKAIIKKAHGAAVIDKLHFLYGAVAPLDKGLWWWFAADLASEFVANWTSTFYQFNGCINGLQNCDWSGNLLPFIIFEPSRDTLIGWDVIEHTGHCADAAGGGIVVPRDWYFQVSYNVRAKPLFSNGQLTLSTWLRNVTTGGTDTHKVEAGPSNPGISQNVHFLYNHQAPSRQPFYHYQFFASADVTAIGISGTCHVRMSQFPILDDAQIGVGCFNRDWGKAPIPLPHVNWPGET